jgi:pyridine nucleotide-disulfide oxidoreductase family protein
VKKLLLLGGGHAHVHVLREMAKERFAAAEVTLVTPFLRQMYSGMVPGVVAGHYRAEQAAIPLAPLAAAAGVNVLETAAVGLDAVHRQVRLADGRTLGYDVLSIDTGSVMDRERLPGASANSAIFVRPIESFLVEIEALFDRVAQRGAERALDVVVVGGGAAGVELALALQYRFARLAGQGVEPSRVALVLGGERTLAGYPDAVMRHAETALNRARITLFRDGVVELREGVAVLANGARVANDAVILVTGSEAPAWLQGSGLALDGHGFIVTGPTLQSGSHPEVFAVGDVATRIDALHPRSGVYAVRAGPPLLANLRAYCSSGHLGPPLKRHMPQTKTLNLISCGRRYAIASRGGWVIAGRWVWWWKNRIDRAFVARYSPPGGGGGAAMAATAATAASGAVGAPPNVEADVIPSAGTR